MQPSSSSMPHLPPRELPSLCPELVVPNGCECTLVVPRLPPNGVPRTSRKNQVGKVVLDDSRGAPVFQVSFDFGSSWHDSRRLMLHSATGDALFAFCCDAEAEMGGADFAGLNIYDHTEKPFGTIRMGGARDRDPSYVVLLLHGSKIRFVGNALVGKLIAEDEEGRLLATSEPLEPMEGGRRSLRIGPYVDAGLMALSFLSIDTLEHQKHSQRHRDARQLAQRREFR